MAGRQESRRSLEEGYITRALRIGVRESIADETRGMGYSLLLGGQEHPVEIQVYPDANAIIVRTELFTLDLASITDIRRRGRRLHIAARCEALNVAVTLEPTGAVGLHARDSMLPSSLWQQGNLAWEDCQVTSASAPPSDH